MSDATPAERFTLMPRLMPRLMVALTVAHLSPTECVEVCRAALTRTEAFTLLVNHRLVGRTLAGDEVARELLSIAREVARAGVA